MSEAYWLGVATPFAVAAVGWLLLLIADWFLWWTRHGFGGKGMLHEVETIYPEYPDEEKWGRVQHPHYWPPNTPWWLIRRMEWLRLWLCLRRPDYRSAQPTPQPEPTEES